MLSFSVYKISIFLKNISCWNSSKVLLCGVLHPRISFPDFTENKFKISERTVSRNKTRFEGNVLCKIFSLSANISKFTNGKNVYFFCSGTSHIRIRCVKNTELSMNSKLIQSCSRAGAGGGGGAANMKTSTALQREHDFGAK